MKNKTIPVGFQYENITSLSIEAKEKLKRIQPNSIGQASRLEGITPSDIAILLIHLKNSQNVPRGTF